MTVFHNLCLNEHIVNKISNSLSFGTLLDQIGRKTTIFRIVFLKQVERGYLFNCYFHLLYHFQYIYFQLLRSLSSLRLSNFVSNIGHFKLIISRIFCLGHFVSLY